MVEKRQYDQKRASIERHVFIEKFINK